MRVLYLHGRQSLPGGVTSTYLSKHGYEVLNPAVPDDDFDDACGSPRPRSTANTPTLSSVHHAAAPSR
jgi:hypothetical protein